MKKIKLGDYGEFRNGVNFSKDQKGEGLGVINVKDIFRSGIYFNPDGLDKVDLSDQNNLKKYLVRDGDIFFVRSSVKREGIGKVSVSRRNYSDIVHCGFVIRYRLNTDEIDPLYLGYLLSSPFYREKLRNLSGGAAITNISQQDLKGLEAELHQFATQQKIASILTSFDNLIENNRRRIEILGEMARRIYREWFVHFRYPGYENDKLVESGMEIGEIPEGWEVKKLEDFGEIVLGKTPSTKDSENYGDYMQFIKTPDMHDQFFIHETENVLSKKGVKTQEKKTLPVDSICVSCIGTAGVVAITSVPSQTNQQINSIVPEESALREYLYFTTKALKPLMEKIGSTGATMTNVSKTKFKGLPALKPSQDLLNKFHEKVGSLFDQISTLQKQNKKLKETRDLLLPKLISGKIDVEELHHLGNQENVDYSAMEKENS